jgi:hypothetical protein
MRWTDFFSHLEHDFALDAHTPRESTHHLDNVDTHVLDVCARAKACGQGVTVGMVTGEVLHVAPRAVATEWFSGLLGGDKGSGVVIPVTAVLWVEGDTVATQGDKATLVRATLLDVLADMARRHAHVTLRTQHSDYPGVIMSVGPGFCDLLLHPTPHSGITRRFPFPAVVAIFQGATAWG